MTELPAFPVPDREAERLLTLKAYEILDTPSDTRFDSLVGIASSHFDAPIALVSLVDKHRQWFKASVGLKDTETPREHAFCAHAIMDPNEVFVVEDATNDHRFKDNPLVTGPLGIRFYAGAPILAENGEPLGTICIIDQKPRGILQKDLDFLAKLAINASGLLELHRTTARLRAFATRDPLTGLVNRRAIEIDISRAVETALEGRPCGLLFIDIDHFKAVNDQYGHDIGDKFLCAIAQRLEASVSSRDRVARLGGDEFVILVANQVGEPEVGKIGRRLLAAFDEPLSIDGVSIEAGLSIGGASAPRDASDPQSLLKAADGALYDAKRAGRRRFVMAKAPGHERADSKDATLQDELHSAIAENGLHLQWQPIVRLADRKIEGFEALARWNHPRLGPISPDVFVSMAEKCGLSRKLDAWVLNRAVAEAARGPSGVRYAINVSPDTFCKADIPAIIAESLARTELPPERVILEITERTLIHDPTAALDTMNRLRSMGVKLALDDFGSGYSTLSYLRNYPFDKLKIDRSLISGLTQDDSRSQLILATIISLANSLGMRVVAEGVETEAQVQLLNAAGCKLAQGYLFARPGALPKRQDYAAA